MYVVDEPWKEPDGSLNMICAGLSTDDLGEFGKEVEKLMDVDSNYEVQLVVTVVPKE